MKNFPLWLFFLLLIPLVWFFFPLPPGDFLKTLKEGITSFSTWRVILIVYFVLVLGRTMRESGTIEEVGRYLRGMMPNKKLALSVPPALVGMLPMPGGALLSAPLIEDVDRSLPPHHLAFINYWFRHIWEYCLPIYPGLIVAAGILEVPIRKLSLYQFPLTFLAFGTGYLFISGFVKEGRKEKEKVKFPWKILPLLFLIILGFRFDLLYLFPLFLIFLFIQHRMNPWKILKNAFSFSTIFLIFVIMVFKHVLTNNPGFQELVAGGGKRYIFLLSFLSGYLTGVNQAYIAMSFPFLVPLFRAGEIGLPAVMYTYTIGFMGVLLSPFHLCLILTREYYGASLKDTYRDLILPVFSIFLLATVWYLCSVQ